jgi:predicted transcriptional regulator
MDGFVALPKVSSFYSKKVNTYNKGTDIFTLIDNLDDNSSSYSVIVDDHSILVGVILDKDLMTSLENTIYFDEQLKSTIIELISTPIGLAKLDWSIFDLENYFLKMNISSALIVDSSNVLLGEVSRKDILKIYGELVLRRLNYKKIIKKSKEVSLIDKINNLIQVKH